MPWHLSTAALEALGWVGSAILVVSLLQTQLFRLRVINLVGCLVLIAYNGLAHVWPMVGLNVVLAVINVVQLSRSVRERHDAQRYEVLRVAPDDAYLRHVLTTRAADIARFNPGFDPGAAFGAGDEAYLVLLGDETVGVVLVADPHLGTLNSIALSAEALAARSLPLLGVVLGTWPEDPGLAETTNVEEIPSVAGAPLLGRIPTGVGTLEPQTFTTQAPTWLTIR